MRQAPCIMAFALAALLAACEWDNGEPPIAPKADPPADTVRVPAGPDFGGCWRVSFLEDSGSISAWQKGQAVGGILDWDDGARDTLSGTLGFPYLRLESRGQRGPRTYLGNVLRTVGHFEAKLLGTPNLRIEKLIGDRVACPSDSAAAP